MASHEPKVLYNMQPLLLEAANETVSCSDEFTKPKCLDCMFCDLSFLEDKQMEWEDHMLVEHSFMIEELESIASLPRYIQFWKTKFSTCSLNEFCVVCTTSLLQPKPGDPKPGDPNPGDPKPGDRPLPDAGCPQAEDRKFYMLSPSTCLEDRSWRHTLRTDVLKCILNHQQKEREDNYLDMVCLFCHQKFTGNRSLLLNHMHEEHHFNIGHPDNIVFAAEFFEQLHEKVNSLSCLYCQKIFKDRSTLKAHMRKKLHKRLKPHNTLYDKFYLINYLDLPKSSIASTGKKTEIRHGKGGVVAVVKHPDSDAEDEWGEEEITLNYICLFCKLTREKPSLVFRHMEHEHSFDMKSLRREYGLSFYHQVKLINYIRRQVLQLDCLDCQLRFENHDALITHMTQETNHINSFVGNPSTWNHPEYFFPTYEDDNLFSGINVDYDTPFDEEVVIPEDPPQINLCKIHEEVKPLIDEAKVREALSKMRISPLSDPVWSTSSGV